MKRIRKNFLSLLLMVSMVFCISFTVQASSTPNSMIWPNDTTVKITKTMKYVRYCGVIKGNAEGTMILRFTEVTSGLSYTKTFICNNGWYTQSRPLPVGTYRVTVEVNQCSNLQTLYINFWQTQTG